VSSLYITLTPSETKIIPYSRVMVVVVDLLRASTTIITALAHGVKAIYPINGEKEINISNRDDILFCGEENGVKIPSFDLGNSPCNFNNDNVSKKTIYLSTSNGTKILSYISSANKIYIGGLINKTKVINRAAKLGKDLYLVCAGTKGEFSLEDFYTAGAIASPLLSSGWKGDDLVLAAARIFEKYYDYQERVKLFFHTRSGQNLIKLGLIEDIYYSSKLDLHNILPIFDGEKILIKEDPNTY